jgi:hypothetical protein
VRRCTYLPAPVDPNPSLLPSSSIRRPLSALLYRGTTLTLSFFTHSLTVRASGRVSFCLRAPIPFPSGLQHRAAGHAAPAHESLPRQRANGAPGRVRRAPAGMERSDPDEADCGWRRGGRTRVAGCPTCAASPRRVSVRAPPLFNARAWSGMGHACGCARLFAREAWPSLASC